MSAKHFINDPTHLVLTALNSCTLANPSLAFDATNKIVYLRPSAIETPQVSVISGGGSGHEPAFGSYVGRGMLTAAVAGTIFASPSAEQVYRAIVDRVDNRKGVAVITLNYTGDVLNFGLAVERAKAKGVNAELVIMADDVGVGRAKGGKVGRRGIGGGIFTIKVAAALAAQGAAFEDVIRTAKLVSESTVSIGASLDRVHVPGRAPPDPSSMEALGPDEVELGMGIHNEPGSQRIKAHLDTLVKQQLQHLLDMNDKDRAFLEINRNDKVVLLLNNLGGVSTLEMGGILAEVVKQLNEDYGIKPVRILVGPWITSLNGLGFSVSLLKIRDTGLGPGKSMLDLLDMPNEAVAWNAAVRTETWDNPPQDTRDQVSEEQTVKSSNLRVDPKNMAKVLRSGLHKVIAAEPEVTKYDTIVGDGDCGIGLKRGAEAVLEMLDSAPLSEDALLDMWKIIPVIESSMDGTSGALYAIFLNALAHSLRQQDVSKPQEVTVNMWAKALKASLESTSKYTPAKPGDRTLMDALYPFVDTLLATADLAKAAEAGKVGAEHTRGMKASLGRTVYVGGEDWQKIPDPGAHGLAQFLIGLAEGR